MSVGLTLLLQILWFQINSVHNEHLLSEGSPLLPGYGEPKASEHSLDRLLIDLVPSYREVNSPVPIPTFLRKVEVVSREPNTMIPDPIVAEVSSSKNLAWSRGLGLMLSLVKTRSAHKKSGTNPTLSTQLLHSSIDQGVLRGIKALARDKS